MIELINVNQIIEWSKTGSTCFENYKINKKLQLPSGCTVELNCTKGEASQDVLPHNINHKIKKTEQNNQFHMLKSSEWAFFQYNLSDMFS